VFNLACHLPNDITVCIKYRDIVTVEIAVLYQMLVWWMLYRPLFIPLRLSHMIHMAAFILKFKLLCIPNCWGHFFYWPVFRLNYCVVLCVVFQRIVCALLHQKLLANGSNWLTLSLKYTTKSNILSRFKYKHF